MEFAEFNAAEHKMLKFPSVVGGRIRALRWRGSGALLAIALTATSCTVQPTLAPTGPPGSPISGATDAQPFEVDRANGVQRFEWSPDHGTLAVVTSGETHFDGRIDLLTADGTRTHRLPGLDATWVDATHLVVLEPAAPDDSLNADAWLVGLEDGTRTQIGTGYASLLGNGHGAVVLAKTASPTFVLWAQGQLTEAPLGGSPVAWSPDGSLLVVATAPRTSLGGLTGSTGGPQPARLVVISPDGWERHFDSLSDLVDHRLPVTFSPDGTRLAATGAAGGTLVFDLFTRAVTRITDLEPFGWTPAGGLVLLSDDRTVRQIREPDGSTSTLELPAGLPVYGPGGAVAVLDAGATFGAGSVTVGGQGTWRTVDGLTAGGGTAITWSADGRRCYVATGTTDASRPLDRVLLVPMP